MPLIRRVLASAVLAALLSLSVASAFAQSRPPATALPPLPKRAETHVYLMRGLLGVFSLGMDDLAVKLNTNGYRSNVYGWDSWQTVAEVIAQRYDGGHRGPIVVIGHSLGANAVFYVADDLQRRSIPVLLGVTFDATEPGKVPTNVMTFVNFWARDGFGKPVEAVPGYNGELDNIDLSNRPDVDHMSIDSLDQFHKFVIGNLEKMTSQ